MGVVYEAVVLEGDPLAVRAAIDRLDVPLALRLWQPADRGFVVVFWLPDSPRTLAPEPVNRAAALLASEFGTTVAIHYDDRCAVKRAMLFRAGQFVREFGPADEVWVPLDDNGEPVVDGPRYPGPEVPADLECDCVIQAIDAALGTAGFGTWITVAQLRGWALGLA